MAGEGSIEPLLRNNRNLLRKTSFFKKEISFSERKKQLLNHHKGTLEFKKISAEELQSIKEDIRAKAKKRNSINFGILLIALCILSSFISK